MYNGTGIFALVYNDQTWIPSECSRYIPDVRNTNIVRRSKITTAVNLREGWDYYNADAKVRRLSGSDITFIRSITGQTVKLYPHIDEPSISYNVIVQKAPIRFEPIAGIWKPYVEFRFEGAENTEILTPTSQIFEITSPTLTTIIQRGNDFIITWSSSEVTGMVSIELWKAGVKVSDIVSETTNDGSYTWTSSSVLAVDDDYQIKIIADDYDGLLYNFSADFSITYDGFVLFDGTNDAVNAKSTLTTLGDEKTIAMFYNRLGTAITANGLLFGSYNLGKREYIEFINSSPDYIRYQVTSATGTTTVLFHTTAAIPFDDAWHSLIIKVKHSTATGEIWIDGVRDTLTVLQADTGYVYASANATYPYKLAPTSTMKIKHCNVYAQLFDDDDCANFHALNLSAITKTPTFLWACNDTDEGAPWTDNITDSSGNGNHGTPVNITAGTFFNQT